MHWRKSVPTAWTTKVSKQKSEAISLEVFRCGVMWSDVDAGSIADAIIDNRLCWLPLLNSKGFAH